MSSLQYILMVFCFLSLTELTKFSILSIVLWSFQVLGKVLMDYGTRSGKSLSLGMPRKASPLSSSSIGNFTWSYIFIHHMICVLLGASCMIWVFVFSLPQSSLLYTPFGRDTHELEFIRILYVLHLYLLSYIVFALVLHSYLLDHVGGFVL